MILEGIVTTQDAAGRLNIAPMGPVVTPEFSTLILRPFQTSTTYGNLAAHPAGVLHITDDVLLIARSALNLLPVEPETQPAERIVGRVLADCCRWFEFEITDFNISELRTRLEARVVHCGRKRDFFGLNRAKHAVIEATILATRLHLLDAAVVRQELYRLKPLVEKTAGEQERIAWEEVTKFIGSRLDIRSDSA